MDWSAPVTGERRRRAVFAEAAVGDVAEAGPGGGSGSRSSSSTSGEAVDQAARLIPWWRVAALRAAHPLWLTPAGAQSDGAEEARRPRCGAWAGS
jgi:hypothetical protein